MSCHRLVERPYGSPRRAGLAGTGRGYADVRALASRLQCPHRVLGLDLVECVPEASSVLPSLISERGAYNLSQRSQSRRLASVASVGGVARGTDIRSHLAFIIARSLNLDIGHCSADTLAQRSKCRTHERAARAFRSVAKAHYACCGPHFVRGVDGTTHFVNGPIIYGCKNATVISALTSAR